MKNIKHIMYDYSKPKLLKIKIHKHYRAVTEGENRQTAIGIK